MSPDYFILIETASKSSSSSSLSFGLTGMFLMRNYVYFCPYYFFITPLLWMRASFLLPSYISFLKSISVYRVVNLNLLLGVILLNYSSTLTKSILFENEVVWIEFFS